MKESIIQQLKNITPEERVVLMNELYKKNRCFFLREMPEVDSFINNIKCPYHIDLTDTFLNIVHSPTGDLAHPSAGLDAFAMMMGDWIHNAWVDLFNIKVVNPANYKIHSGPLIRMASFLKEKFPKFIQSFANREIPLKILKDGRRYSPPTIFLGIFHGLHIAHFLANTEISKVLFIEPDVERFEVSCYFLDYEAIKENLNGRFYLAIGDYERAGAIQLFFNWLSISQNIWTRVLPAYSCNKFPIFIENFKILQTAHSDITFPLDLELRGLVDGLNQIKNKRYLLSKNISTSRQCRIVVVATGPSLIDDIDWLRNNQEKLIIFAVHSSVKILKDNKITPDFQFSLEMEHRTKEVLAQLDLFKEKPLIQYYKAPDEYFCLTDETLMIVEKNKANPVMFKKTIDNTHPSTTCLAFSFACYCKPDKIYLLGCDFGYRSKKEDHAVGSIYSNQNEPDNTSYKSDYGTTIQALMKPNFIEKDLMQTTTFLSFSRNTIESLIELRGLKGKIINLSDGVQIRGTTAQKSNEIALPRYVNKKKDINSINRAFERAEIHKNWSPYPVSGEEMFGRMKKLILETLSIKSFSWASMSNAIDNVLPAIVDMQRNSKDVRMEIFSKVISDLLILIYCSIIFMDSENESASVYCSAISEMEKILNRELNWPTELDEILLL